MTTYKVEFIRSLQSEYAEEKITTPVMQCFLALYEQIREKDAINPLFCQTAKYNQFMQNAVRRFKRKHDKILFDNGDGQNGNKHEVGENAWVPFQRHTGNKQLLVTIKSILNKISPTNYFELISELLTKLEQYSDMSILHVISKEIYQKAIFDIQYQNIYIDICHRLWTNYRWQDGLYSVVVPEDNERQFYYYLHDETLEQPELKGPYSSEEEVCRHGRMSVFFKCHFVNYLQKKHDAIDSYIEKIEEATNECDEEEAYKNKRNVYGVLEIVARMYVKKYIHPKIVHVCFLRLLGYVNGTISEEYLEGFQRMWSILAEHRSIEMPAKFIKQYFTRLQDIRNQSELSKRIEFMLTDLIEKYKETYENNAVPDNTKENTPTPDVSVSVTMDAGVSDETTPVPVPAPAPVPVIVNVKETIEPIEIDIEVELKKFRLSQDYKALYAELNKKGIWVADDVWYSLLSYLCEWSALVPVITKMLKEYLEKNIITLEQLKTALEAFMEEIEDIELDYPKARDTMKKFRDGFKL